MLSRYFFPYYEFLILGRFLWGAANGVAIVVQTVWIIESAPTDQRGKVNSWQEVIATSGSVFFFVYFTFFNQTTILNSIDLKNFRSRWNMHQRIREFDFNNSFWAFIAAKLHSQSSILVHSFHFFSLDVAFSALSMILNVYCTSRSSVITLYSVAEPSSHNYINELVELNFG